MSHIPQPKQKGSALIVALAMLTLLTLMAIAFTGNMRIERKASELVLTHTDAKWIAQTGLHHAINLLLKDLDDDQTASQMYDDLTEDWYDDFIDADQAVALNPSTAALSSKWIYVHSDPDDDTTPVIGRYAVFVRDLNGAININTAGTTSTGPEQNEGFGSFEINLEKLPFDADATINSQIANYVIEYRQGGSGFLPGEDGVDDDNNSFIFDNDGVDNNGDGSTDGGSNEGQDDPYELWSYFPFQDDQPFTSLEELIQISDISATELNAVDGLRAYATAENLSEESYWNAGSWNRKINMNHVGEASRLYNLMTGSGIAANNAYQWSANILDYADTDFIPHYLGSTPPNFGGGDRNGNMRLGIEGLRINEILANTNWEVDKENDGTDPTSGTAPGYSSAGTFTDLGWGVHEGFVGNTHDFEWSWDNGAFLMDIQVVTEHGAGGSGYDYVFENGEAGQQAGTATGNVGPLTVLVSGNKLNFRITDKDDTATAGADGWTHFDRLKIRPGGDYIEIVNISKKDMPSDGSNFLDGTWFIAKGGEASPSPNGYLLHNAGGTLYNLSGFKNKSWGTPGILSAANPGVTYNFFMLAESLYALDHTAAPIIGGDNDGVWTHGPILYSPTDPNNKFFIDHTGTPPDLFLLKSFNGLYYVIDVAPGGSNAYNIQHYGSSAENLEDVSRERRSPWDITDFDGVVWENSTDQNSTSPGENNTINGPNNVSAAPENEFWQIQDSSFASIGEIGIVPTSNNTNGTIEVNSDASVQTLISRLSNSAIYLFCDDADGTPGGWGSTAASGPDYYTAPDNNSAGIWTWTMNSNDTANKIRLEDGATYDVITYGFVDASFPRNYLNGGNNILIQPDGSAYYGTATASNNSISITIQGNSTNIPNLRYIVLTPRLYIPGKINVNTASTGILEALPGISNALAANIIATRPIDSISDLLSAANIDEPEYRNISNLITLRSDMYEVIVFAQSITDTDADGNEGDAGTDFCGDNDGGASDTYPSSILLRAVVDRNASFNNPNTRDVYQIRSVTYDPDYAANENSC